VFTEAFTVRRDDGTTGVVAFLSQGLAAEE
jgi:hypothetical protein